MQLVDFHCHLDLYPDPSAMIADVDARGIRTLTVTTTPKAWPKNLEFTRHASRVRVALGLHPQLVADRADEIKLWEKYLPEAKYIGEVGIDAGPRFRGSFDLQKQVFERILVQSAQAGGKIITVHSVCSAKIVLDLIEEHFPSSKGTVVLHWFTGTSADVRRAIDLGCYFSINFAMLNNDRGKVLVKSLPQERILTETDGPFILNRNHPFCPADIEIIVKQLAGVLSVSQEIAEKKIISNFKTLSAKVDDVWD